jgi:hypothetical protein
LPFSRRIMIEEKISLLDINVMDFFFFVFVYLIIQVFRPCLIKNKNNSLPEILIQILQVQLNVIDVFFS